MSRTVPIIVIVSPSHTLCGAQMPFSTERPSKPKKFGHIEHGQSFSGIVILVCQAEHRVAKASSYVSLASRIHGSEEERDRPGRIGWRLSDQIRSQSHPVPKGRFENSPAFQRRVLNCNVTSPEGTAEMRFADFTRI